MSETRSDRVERLFEEGSRVPPDQLASWLDRECGSDTGLRAELQSLLSAAQHAPNYLDELAQDIVGPTVRELARQPLDEIAESPDPLIGRTVHHFTILERMAGGGMGVVYRATDTRLDRVVALKFLAPELNRDPLAKRRFVQEARAASALEHENICAVHDIGESDDGRLYIAMPCYDGETLRSRIQHRRLTPEEAVPVATQIADALAAAHASGIVHRDVKPANVLITARGVVKLLDFGLARTPDTTRTDSGVAAGTVSYMSPEQAAGEAVDARTDVWALGAVLYEMLSGERPFRGGNPQAVIYAILSTSPTPIQALVPECPPDLARTVMTALQKDPDRRFQSGGELAAALRKGPGASDDPTVISMPRPVSDVSPGRTRRVAGLVGVGLLAAIGVWFGVRAFLPAVAGPTVREGVVAVFPLRSPENAALGEGLADLLAAALDGTGGLNAADPAALWSPLRTAEGSLRAPELDEAMTLARRAAAGKTVLGSVSSAGENLELIARVYDTRGELLGTMQVSTVRDSTYAAVDRLAIEIVTALRPEMDEVLLPTDGQPGTGSVDALQAYLDARRLRFVGRYEEALDAIERATSLDSAFALAHLEHFTILANVQFSNGQAFSGLPEIIDRAMTFRDRLGPRNRYRIEGYKALNEMDAANAAARFDRILAFDSTDLDAWQGLGITYLEFGWQIGKGLDEIDAVATQMRRLQPQSAWATTTLARLASARGDLDAMERLVRELRADQNPYARALAAALDVRLAPDPAERAVRLESAASLELPSLLTVFRILRNDQPRAADALASLIMESGYPVMHQRTGLGARSQLRIGAGAVASVDSIVRAGRLDAIRSTINRFFVTAALADVGDPAATARALGELRTYAPRGSLSTRAFEAQDVVTSAWAVGAYEAMLGDTVAARQWHDAIEDIPLGETGWDWRQPHTLDIAARLALRRGDRDTALQTARAAAELWFVPPSNVLESEPEPATRFLLAELLRGEDLIAQATRTYRSFTAPVWAGFYTARANLTLAELAETDGDTQRALFHYGQAVLLWDLGGPEVTDWLARARSGQDRIATSMQ